MSREKCSRMSNLEHFFSFILHRVEDRAVGIIAENSDCVGLAVDDHGVAFANRGLAAQALCLRPVVVGVMAFDASAMLHCPIDAISLRLVVAIQRTTRRVLLANVYVEGVDLIEIVGVEDKGAGHSWFLPVTM